MEYPTEQEYAEAFGVEPEETGAESPQDGSGTQEGQGDAPAAETAADGNGEAGEGEEDGAGGGDAAAEGADGQQTRETETMSPEERHRQAAARRAREEQARAAAEQARVDQVYAEMFAGQTNPYTGQPIRTEAEYRAYITERDQRQQTAQLRQAGIDPKTIQGIVNQQLAPLQQRLQVAEMSAMQEKARMASARAQEAISRALTNISAMDPDVKTMEDIARMPTAPRFNELVQKGIGMEDAFYLANRQAIDTRRAAAAKAATINRMANRSHLNPTRAPGAKLPVEVPREVVEAYRYMMPDATDAEIQKAYAAELEHQR